MAQEAWKTAIFILTALCDTMIGQNGHDESMLDFLSNSLEITLQIQLRWKLSKKYSIKNQSTISLLEDFSKTNRFCQNKRLFFEWCQQMNGIHVTDCAGWGGLRHALCEPPGDTRLFHSVIELCRTQSDKTDMYELRKRLLLRGLLAQSIGADASRLLEQGLAEAAMGTLSRCETKAATDLVLSFLYV